MFKPHESWILWKLLSFLSSQFRIYFHIVFGFGFSLLSVTQGTSHCHFISFFAGFHLPFFVFLFSLSVDIYSFHLFGWSDSDLKLQCAIGCFVPSASCLSYLKLTNKCNFSVLLTLIHENFRIMIIMFIRVSLSIENNSIDKDQSLLEYLLLEDTLIFIVHYYLFVCLYYSHFCNQIQINCGFYKFSIPFNSNFAFCINIESVFRFVFPQITWWKWILKM